MAGSTISSNSLADTVKLARENLGRMLEQRVTHFANRNYLWRDEKKYLAMPVSESDPELIQVFKRVFLALEAIEKLLVIVEEYKRLDLLRKQPALSRYEQAKALFNQISVLKDAYSIFQQDLEVHLAALSQLPSSPAVQGSMNSLVGSLKGFGFKELITGQLPRVGSKLFSSTLNDGFVGLMNNYFEFQRPVGPNLPERQYKDKAEAALEKRKKIHVRDKFEVVSKIVGPATAAVKMLETVLEDFERKMAEEEKSRGIAYTTAEKEVIQKTMDALKNKTIKEDGSIAINKEGETPISEAVKTVLNILLCANEVYRNPDPGVWALMSFGRKVKPYADGLDKFELDPELMNKELRGVYGVLGKTAIAVVRDMLYPGIVGMAQQTHDFEFRHHLRFGALSTEVRPVFDTLEKMCLGQGVPIENPFGVIKENKGKKEEYEDLYKQKMIIKLVASLLTNYINNKKLTESEQGDLKKYLGRNTELAAMGIRQDWFTESDPGRLKDAVAVVAKAEKDISAKLAGKTLEFQTYSEAKREQEKIRLEFFIRTLKKGGLNLMLRAAQVAPGNAELNLTHKHNLAVLLADYDNKSRGEYLINAHDKTKKLLQKSDQITKIAGDLFSGKLGSENKSLGQALAIEVTLGGFVKVGDWENTDILSGSDPSVVHQNLINVLTRLEASQVIDLFNKGSAGDVDARKRLALFKLLITEKTYSQDQLDKALTESSTLNHTLAEWVGILASRYKQLESEVSPANAESMNKIGLFLARLAHANPENATIIFSVNGAEKIIKDECLLSDKTLYYEALVNTFSFNYVELKHEDENRTFSVFLDKNKESVWVIHKIMNPNEASLSEQKVIEQYQNDPWALAQLIQKFTNTHVESGSKAEEKLREFFSAMTLCLGEGKLIRKKIFDGWIEMEGVMQEQYVAMLTKPSQENFWNKVKDDMTNAPMAKFTAEFKSIAQSMDPLTNTLLSAKRHELTEKQASFIGKKEEKISEKLENLKKVTENREGDVSKNCRIAHLSVEAEIKAVREERNKWVQEVISYHKDEAVKGLPEQKKALLKQMKDKKIDEVSQGRILASMENYHPESMFDAQFGSLKITNVTDAEAAKMALLKCKEEVSRDINQKLTGWQNNISDMIKSWEDCKGLRGRLETIHDKVFDVPFLGEDRYKQALKSLANAVDKQHLFEQVGKYWQDAGVLYKFLVQTQIEVENLRTTIPELKDKGIDAKLKVQSSLMLQEIVSKLKPKLVDAIHNGSLDQIDSLIRTFPEVKEPIDSSLQVVLLLATIAKQNIVILNTTIPAILNQVSMTEERRKGMTAALSACVAKQNEMAERVMKHLPDFERAHVALLDEQSQLQALYKKQIEDIKAIHFANLKSELEILYNNSINSCMASMNGRVDVDFQETVLQGLMKKNPAKAFNDYFLLKASNMDDVGKAIAELTEMKNELSSKFSKYVGAYLINADVRSVVDSNDAKILKNEVEIIKIQLQDYLDNRAGFTAALYKKVFMSPLRSQQVEIVKACLDEITNIEKRFSGSHNYALYAEALSKQIGNLVERYGLLPKDKDQAAGLMADKLEKLRESVQRLELPQKNRSVK